MGLRNLFLAVDRPIISSLVASATSLETIARPTFGQGDTDEITLCLTDIDPAGGFRNQRTRVNLAGYTFRIALGVPGGTPIAIQTSWVNSADNLSSTCSLALNTAGIDTLVGGNGQAASTLSLKVNDGTGWTTRAILACAVYESIDDNTTNTPTPVDEYYEKATSDALYAKRLMEAGGSITWTSSDGTKQTIQYLRMQSMLRLFSLK